MILISTRETMKTQLILTAIRSLTIKEADIEEEVEEIEVLEEVTEVEEEDQSPVSKLKKGMKKLLALLLRKTLSLIMSKIHLEVVEVAAAEGVERVKSLRDLIETQSTTKISTKAAIINTHPSQSSKMVTKTFSTSRKSLANNQERRIGSRQ